MFLSGTSWKNPFLMNIRLFDFSIDGIKQFFAYCDSSIPIPQRPHFAVPTNPRVFCHDLYPTLIKTHSLPWKTCLKQNRQTSYYNFAVVPPRCYWFMVKAVFSLTEVSNKFRFTFSTGYLVVFLRIQHLATLTLIDLNNRPSSR